MRSLILILLAFAWAPVLTSAQELNCTVNLNDQKIQTQQRQIFRKLQDAMSQFVNNRTWTTDPFEPEERISCAIYITLEEQVDETHYKGRAQIQVSRPVYGSTYESVLLNYIDRNFNFEYSPGLQLLYNDNAYVNNLTSLLAYYAYIIIGTDYDSFSELGGQPYFLKAQNIVNNATSSGENGWDGFADRDRQNRYWLVENLLNNQVQPFRTGFYKYHRLGLDQYIDDPNAAREVMLSFLEDIQKVNQVKPGTVLLNSFFNAKSQEFINFFKEATPEQKKKAVILLAKLDPTNTGEYQKIMQ